MELQLGLALPTSPVNDFDLNCHVSDPTEAASSDLCGRGDDTISGRSNKKRGFIEAFELHLRRCLFFSGTITRTTTTTMMIVKEWRTAPSLLKKMMMDIVLWVGRRSNSGGRRFVPTTETTMTGQYCRMEAPASAAV
ncbi:hypothetical protein CK203_113287 [Vitis vinifera]|uniref:Uncharacterized protein n=1 Tax=Vitis vinifera TaxID=29760 RepID=A0A438EIF1_VITVI|nr:hypothetical protein CK203_113287 [Vitis vinifera]